MMARSWLFVPGDSDKKLDKVADCGADAVILDLEDAVAEARKAVARDKVGNYLANAQRDHGPQLWVRINPMDGPHLLADIAAVVPQRPTGVFLPKPDSAAAIERLDHYLTALEAAAGIEPGTIRIMTVAESARGFLAQRDFPGCSPRLSTMTWGAEDMSADLGASTNRGDDGELFLIHKLSRAQCLVVCAAGELQAVDGGYMDYRDLDGLERECAEARREGFTGKIAIHPAQVAIINEAMTPSAEEANYAQRVIQAFAEAEGAGTVGLDGNMLDLPHLKQARRVLALTQRK